MDQVDILDLYQMLRDRWAGLDAILAVLPSARPATEEET